MGSEKLGMEDRGNRALSIWITLTIFLSIFAGVYLSKPLLGFFTNSSVSIYFGIFVRWFIVDEIFFSEIDARSPDDAAAVDKRTAPAGQLDAQILHLKFSPQPQHDVLVYELVPPSFRHVCT